MSKQEKLVKKLLNRPKNCTINELKTVLTGFGYQEYRGGKTSGSKVAFIHAKSKHIMRIHQPHSGNELKAYQIALIIEELKKQGTIKE